MDANRVLNATLNGAASAAAVYLAGRIGGYRFPRVAAVLVGSAVGLGSYRAMAGVDFEAIEEAAKEVATEAEAEAIESEMDASSEIDVTVDTTDEDAPSRPPRQVLSSAVEHAMGFRAGADEPSA